MTVRKDASTCDPDINVSFFVIFSVQYGLCVFIPRKDDLIVLNEVCCA